jgi:hypothetical protein
MKLIIKYCCILFASTALISTSSCKKQLEEVPYSFCRLTIFIKMRPMQKLLSMVCTMNSIRTIFLYSRSGTLPCSTTTMCPVLIGTWVMPGRAIPRATGE